MISCPDPANNGALIMVRTVDDLKIDEEETEEFI